MTPQQERALVELIEAAEQSNALHHLWNSIAYTPAGQDDFYRFKAALQAIRELLEEEELA
jgi:hypothetical protein